MQVIVLAAGLGARLGEATRETPKALIHAAGKPLIHYALRFARRAGASRIVVVSGFYSEDLHAFVATDDAGAQVVENLNFHKGNILSARTGLAHIEPASGFLLMNTDHIYKPAITDIVARITSSAGEITGFCDFDRELGADDMKVRLDETQRIREIAKTLATWDAGYVGMTYVPAARGHAYVDALAGVVERDGDMIHVERVLAHLATTDQPPCIGDVSGHGWLEIDEPHELSRAEDTLARQRWW
jgi:choline kinase